MGRPATGQTPVRSVRIPDHTWLRAKAHAEANGHHIGDVIAKLLDRYSAAEERKAAKKSESAP